MKTETSRKLALVGFLGATAVAMGALGAHALKQQAALGHVTALQLSAYETGVTYHMTHALALLGLAIITIFDSHKYIRIAFNLMGVGILFFSGSLYLLALRDLLGAPWLSFVGPVTPLGGLLLIAGWLMLAARGLRKVKEEKVV